MKAKHYFDIFPSIWLKPIYELMKFETQGFIPIVKKNQFTVFLLISTPGACENIILHCHCTPQFAPPQLLLILLFFRKSKKMKEEMKERKKAEKKNYFKSLYFQFFQSIFG